jgi:hypothetical protein
LARFFPPADMIERIQSVLEPCGIKKEAIVNAVEESLKEIIRDGSRIHPWLLPLALWKIFESRGFILIHHKTPAGNVIPFDVIVFAYAILGEAKQNAIACGLDELDASDALIHVAHVISDRLATGKCVKIQDMRKYMFVGYTMELKRIVQKIGVIQDFCGNEPESDDGAFFDAIENAMLYDEIVGVLSEKEEYAVACRCIMGCSFKETAKMVGLSNAATRQLVSRAKRKMGEVYRKKRVAGCNKAARTVMKRSPITSFRKLPSKMVCGGFF